MADSLILKMPLVSNVYCNINQNDPSRSNTISQFLYLLLVKSNINSIESDWAQHTRPFYEIKCYIFFCDILHISLATYILWQCHGLQLCGTQPREVSNPSWKFTSAAVAKVTARWSDTKDGSSATEDGFG